MVLIEAAGPIEATPSDAVKILSCLIALLVGVVCMVAYVALAHGWHSIRGRA